MFYIFRGSIHTLIAWSMYILYCPRCHLREYDYQYRRVENHMWYLEVDEIIGVKIDGAYFGANVYKSLENFPMYKIQMKRTN